MCCRMTALILGFALACGGDADVPAAGNELDGSGQDAASNEPPLVRSLRLLPAVPTVGDRLAVSIRTSDPDADPVSLEVDWLRNGYSFSKGNQTTLETNGFSRGDQIVAEVTISDGHHTLVQRTEPVTISNQTPIVSSIRLMPEEPNAGTPITVFAEAVDSDRDDIELRYEWFVNGKRVEGADTADLPSSKFRRGDRVEVAVTAHDGREEGAVSRSPVLTIPNGAPVFDSSPDSAKVYDGKYTYAVKASDPDKDRPLRYELVEGPEGMRMDLLSGVVSWRVPQSAKGSKQVVLSVADPHGGKAQQSYTIELSWDAPASSDE